MWMLQIQIIFVEKVGKNRHICSLLFYFRLMVLEYDFLYTYF